MRILMTGSSSFTGFWFAKTLATKGHQITLTFTRNKEDYSGLRKERIEQLCQFSTIESIWNCSFGDDKFLDLLGYNFDTVCHHGAYVEDYKSLDFDVSHAVAENTHHCNKFISLAKEKGVKKFVLTGSVFEANEGTGSLPLVAFSPYGLSKSFTWETFRYWAWKYDMALTKFVIPNPFGPFEEPRFCNYLIQSWAKGSVPCVKTPDYIRDNIHVDLLANCYTKTTENETNGIVSVNPSGYTGSQKDFTLKFAKEMESRLNLECRVDFAEQKDFDEPVARINMQPATESCKNWDESDAWDQLANYYRQMIEKNKQ